MGNSLLEIQPHKISRNLKDYSIFLYGEPKTGKCQPVSTIIPTPSGMKRLGDIKPGDYVYNRRGTVTRVSDVFPQGEMEVYKVEFEDGRYTYCNDEHIWTTIDGEKKKDYTTIDMFDLMSANSDRQFFIPMNSAVDRPYKDLKIESYALGCFIGGGLYKEKLLTISSDSEHLIEKLSALIGAKDYRKDETYDNLWNFISSDGSFLQTDEFLGKYSKYFIGETSDRIPEDYLEGTVQQRVDLLQGLLDINGEVKSNYDIIFTSTIRRIILDVGELVHSLGYKAFITTNSEVDDRVIFYNSSPYYTLTLEIPNKHKYELFKENSKKMQLALKAYDIPEDKEKYNKLAIRRIHKLDCKEEMVCIYVNDDEHLYLTNDYIVTHNTTLATRLPKSLLLATEKGYNALPGVMAKPIDTWAQFRMTLSELRDPDVKERFDVVVIDTADLLYGMCEKYVCDRESNPQENKIYGSVGEIPYGAGYGLVEKEYDDGLQRIVREGYGLILISHAVSKKIKDEYGEEFDQITSTVEKRGKRVCERLCDFICYCRQVKNDEGKLESKLFFRGNSFVSGSRFSEICSYTDMTYDAFIKAFNDAIDAEERKAAGSTTEDSTRVVSQEVKYDFEAQREEFNRVAKIIMEKYPDGGAEKIVSIVEAHLGAGRKVSECTPVHSEQLELILFELKKEFSIEE